MNNKIMIVGAKDGYAPSKGQIRRVLSTARREGFRTDWLYCGVLENHALCFSDLSTEPNQGDLFYFRGRFYAGEVEYLEKARRA